VTAADLLVLAPWLIFGAALAAICYRLLSRRGAARRHRRPLGSCRNRMPRLHGSGPTMRSGIPRHPASHGTVPPWTTTENATTTKMIS
jgi:hypothetical protein